MENNKEIIHESEVKELIIGFRGDVEMIPFLMKETERLERMYPQEAYAQGPILAIQELAVRFLN